MQSEEQTDSVGSVAVSAIECCQNCGAALLGEYCTHCGQRERGREIRIADLAEDALEGLVHPDSRQWRTLIGLLFRPGYVTAEYLSGHRARFLPPVRLYLVISFILFLALSILPTSNLVVMTDPDDPDALTILEEQGLITDEQSRERLRQALEKEKAQESGEIHLWDESDSEKPQWIADLESRLQTNLEEIQKDSSAFSSLMLERMPQLLFLLLPMFALVLRLAYLFSPFHYLQHLIFSLHYHSFIFLLSLFLIPMNLVYPMNYTGPAMLTGVIYLPFAMRRVYASRWPATIFKLMFVLMGYGTILVFAGIFYFLVNLASM